MKITLYRGAPATSGGQAVSLRCAELDLEQALEDNAFIPTSSNFYRNTFQDAEQRTFDFLYIGPTRAGVPGYDCLSYTYFSEYDTADDLIGACPAPVAVSGGYEQTGFTIQSTRPADWDLHCRDWYYTQEQQSSPDGDLTFYQGIFTGQTPPSWPGTDVYKNTALRQLFYTANNNVFGAWRSMAYNSNTNKMSYYAGAAHGNGNGINDSAGGVSTTGWADARIGGVSGTLCNWALRYGSPEYIGTNGIGADALPGSPDKLRLIPVHFWYDGIEFIGIMTLELAADGLPAYATMSAWSLAFYQEGSGPSGDPGDWGEITGGVKPSAQAVATADIHITPVSAALQQTTWGGNAGGLRTWVFTETDYSMLMDRIWSQNILERVWKFGTKSPGDGIISVHQVPRGYTYNVAATGHISTFGVGLGGRESGWSMQYPTQRIYTVDMGQCSIPDATGKFTSYDGATCEIFLPFCGQYTLDIKKVMRGTLYLEYRIDIMTGDCIAFLSVSTDYPDGAGLRTMTSLLLSAQGNCAMQVPWAYSDGGVQNKLNAINGVLTAALAANAGNVGGMVAGFGGMLGAAGQNVSASASTGGAGTFGQLQPYVWIKYPVPLNPSSMQGTVGHASGWGGTVGAGDDGTLGGVGAYGYQRYSAVDVSGIPCTAEEAEEIEKLLLSGIYLGGDPT